MAMVPLSDKQGAIFGFIAAHIKDCGFPPTVREIGRKFRIASPNGVMCHLKSLEKKGYILRLHNMSRAITILGDVPEPPVSREAELVIPILKEWLKRYGSKQRNPSDSKLILKTAIAIQKLGKTKESVKAS